MLDLTSLEKAAGQLEKALRYAVHARQTGEAESLSFQDTIREAARAGLLDDPERWDLLTRLRGA